MSPLFSKLGDVAEFINGAAFKPEDWGEEGKQIIRIQNLNDSTKPYNRTTRVVPERLHVYPGDILVSWSASLGVFEWTGPDIGVLNQHIFRVLPDTSKVDKRYLRHALELALLDMQRHLHGATMMHVNRGEFLATKLFLPSLPEQRRIAAILDQADALRAKRREALAELDQISESTFLEMFGDPVSNPLNWPRAKLVELLSSGPQNGLYKPASDYGDGTPILRIDGFYDGVVTNLGSLKRVRIGDNELQTWRLFEGDIVINRVNSREYLGKSALIPSLAEPTIFESNMMRFSIKDDKALPQYIIQFLQTAYIRGQIAAAAKDAVNQSSINQQDVKGFIVNLPPVELQRKFKSRQEFVNRIKVPYRKSLEAYNSLFSSLQHRAFRGEL